MSWGGHKYGARRTIIDGKAFPSKLEAAVYSILSLMQKAGEISDLSCQHTVRISEAQIPWKVDFSFTRDGKTVYCEAKGIETSDYLIKKKLWKYYGPGKLEIYKGRYTNPKIAEVIDP